MFLSLFLFALFALDNTLAVEVNADCAKPLDMGKATCKDGKKEIKYHFDFSTFTCMAFQYTGCGGNENRFKSEGECYRTCLPIDHFGCPAKSEPLKGTDICHDDKDCGAKGICKWGSGFGICCDKSISDKVDADYNPKCPKGKKVVKFTEGGISTTLVGKTCKSNHCPKNATCMKGTYLATCCA